MTSNRTNNAFCQFSPLAVRVMLQHPRNTASICQYDYDPRRFNCVLTERRTNDAINILISYSVLLRHESKRAEIVYPYNKDIDRLASHSHYQLSTLVVIFRLGELLQKERRLKEAETLYRWSLGGLPVGDPFRLYFLNELGVLQSGQVGSECVEEDQIYQLKGAPGMALNGHTETSEDDNMWARTVVFYLEEHYKSQGKLQDVTPLLTRSLLGPFEGFTEVRQNALCRAWKCISAYRRYISHNMLVEAQDLCDMALTVLVETFGHNHKLTKCVAEGSLRLFLQTKQIKRIEKTSRNNSSGIGMNSRAQRE